MPQEIRLYVPQSLKKSGIITLNTGQSHYLINVMRCKVGGCVSLFNGQDGQWQAEIISISKKSIVVSPVKQTRPQSPAADLWLVFSPIKNKTELVVEKATELGVSKILTVITRHAVVRSVNMEKLTAHAVESSEQCERLDIPALETYKDLSYLLGAWEADRMLLYGDESGGGNSLTKILENMRHPRKIAVLIGPEGGFSPDEFAMLRACGFTEGFGMGPRIMRADTASIAALACIQAQSGGWEEKPHFISTAW